MISDLSLCQTSLNSYRSFFCLCQLDVLIFEVSFPNGLCFNPTGKFNIWEAIKYSFNSLYSVYID